MAENTKIQWTDHTWNPWTGCKKVSSGCKFCYMYRDKERYGLDPTTVIRSKPPTFNKPLNWKEPAKVFTCSWSDFFIEEADLCRDDAWQIIKDTPHLTYQILTKRPERIIKNLPYQIIKTHISEPNTKLPYIPSNVWLGVSAGNQEDYEKMWLTLKTVKLTLGGVFFLSLEPLTDPIDLSRAITTIDETEGIQPNWVIVGGESGNEKGKYRYRKCELDWITSIVDQCLMRKIPVCVKQLGTHLSKELGLKDRHGGDWNEWPGEIQIRQFPKTIYQ